MIESNQAQENLREQFLQEAKGSISGVEEDSNILAAILTGSAAWGKPNPAGDLDILLIAHEQRGVVYRYLVPKFCPVPRRTELGYIPYRTAVEKIKEGHRNQLSCSLIEQLKHGRVLFQRGSQGDDLIDSCRRIQPSRLIIGELLNNIRGVLREIKWNIDQGHTKGATLAIRRMVQLSVRVLLLARERTGIAKEKHEYRAVRRCLNEMETAEYERLLGIKGIGEKEARRTVGSTIDFMKRFLQRWSISPDLVNYE